MIWVVLAFAVLAGVYWLGWSDRGMEEMYRDQICRFDRMIKTVRRKP